MDNNELLIVALKANLATVTAERDAAIKDSLCRDHCDACVMGANALRAQKKEPCEYCGTSSPSGDCILPNGNEQILCSRNGIFGDCYVMERKIRYCPMCGRTLKGVDYGD